MEMHQLRYFLAVARTLNFTRAADECHVTQPSLTRAIQKLEEEFGGLLFQRERSRTHLTDLGREMLPHMERAYAAAQAARALAKDFGRSAHAPLRLGLAASFEHPALGDVLAALCAQFSGVEIAMTAGEPAGLLDVALKGDLDLLIIDRPDPVPERFESWPLFDEPLAVAVRDDHPVAALSRPSFADVKDVTWIDAAGTGAVLRQAFAERGCVPRLVASAGNEYQARALVGAGVGCALVGSRHSSPPLALRELDDLQLVRPVVIGAIAGRKRSVTADAFVKAACAAAWAT